MKKESSEEAVRNQYVSENEYLKLSINRASLGLSGRPVRGMQGTRSYQKQENDKIDGSGNGGTGSVMDYIRKYKNGDNDSSSDDDDDNDVDVDDDDGSSDDNNDVDVDDDDGSSDDNNDDDDDDNDEEEELNRLELEEGDSIDDDVTEKKINRKKGKLVSENKINGNIINIENSVEKEKDIAQIEEEEEEVVDGVKNMPVSLSPHKSILEEFEEMENENENMSNMELKNIMKFSTREIEDDSEVEVESSPPVKSFPTPEGDFEYIDNVEEKDNNEIDERMNLEQIFPEIKNSLKNEISSNLGFLNQLDDEDSDDYLSLHRNNVDDVLQNLLDDFKINININSKTSKKKKTKKNISKSELKNAKEKKSSLKKITNSKELKLSHSSLIANVDNERKRKGESGEKHFLSEKKKSSTEMIFQDEEKKEISISHFNSIFSHKKTILCFTLAITIHYFIFSGISKLV